MFRRIGRSRVIPATALLITALTLTVSAVPSENFKPEVAPPNSKPHGLSYGEWGAEWWKWIFSLPVHDKFGNVTHPGLINQGPVDCSYAQSTHPHGKQVWFLVGSFGGPASRSCIVPTGTKLFFPLLNIAWDNVGVDPPLSVRELVAIAAQFVANVSELHATANGRRIVSDLTRYRGQFAPFRYSIPDDNLYRFWGLDLPKQTIGPAVSDGYWLMLEPLPPGTYIINFGGIGKSPPDYTSSFTVDVTYKLIVVPRGRFE